MYKLAKILLLTEQFISLIVKEGLWLTFNYNLNNPPQVQIIINSEFSAYENKITHCYMLVLYDCLRLSAFDLVFEKYCHLKIMTLSK